MVVAVPIGVATILVSKPFIDTLYGAPFENAVPVLRLYGIVTILTFMTILLGRFCIATGRAKIWNAFMFCAIVATVPLDIVLVPWTSHRYHNGALGGVISYIVTEGFLLVAGTVFLARSLLTGTTALRALRCATGAAAMFAVGWPLRDKSFVLPAIVSLAAYAAVMIALKTFEPDEWRHIRSIADAPRKVFGARFRPRAKEVTH